jgi:hypothetical protein
MNRHQHIAQQAAGSVDTVIEQMEHGQPDPVDVAVMRANLRAALDAGIHPMEVNAFRRTTPA